MSPSNESDTKRSTTGRNLGTLVLVVGLLVLGFVVFALPSLQHNARGETINRYGAELLAELDSLGPVRPATGERALSRISDLWGDDTDPGRSWHYSGSATYYLNPQSDTQSTPDEAREALCQYLRDHGWTQYGEDNGGPSGETRFSRGGGVRSGGWSASVYPVDKTETTAELNFTINSAEAGGFLPY